MMTIEEKAKAYDIALDKLKRLFGTGDNCTREEAEYIFPELVESENEKMIQYFKDLAPFDKAEELYEKYGFSHKDAIAWLEKKCEQKQEWSEEIEGAISLLNDMAEEQEKDYCPHNANDLRKAAQYLETCRPQSTWKPTDEQIDALDFAADCIVPAEFCFKRKALKELLEQLKKL